MTLLRDTLEVAQKAFENAQKAMEEGLAWTPGSKEPLPITAIASVLSNDERIEELEKRYTNSKVKLV
jgi:hypothetical protein